MWWTNNLCVWTDNKQPSHAKLSKMKNNFVFQNEYFRNLLDALHRYKIEGLPETCSQRVILESLLFNGIVFFFEKNNDVLALPGCPDGSGMNAYGDFGGAWVYGMNGFNERISLMIPGSDESVFLTKTVSGNNKTGRGVMVRENKLMFPFINQVIYYSERQADTLRKIETAQKNAATPYLIVAEQSVVSTVKNYMERRDNNEEIIVSSGVFPADKVSLLPFDIQSDSIKVMSETYDWYCNHFRELCSVKNMTNIDKKGENLLTDEINISDEYTKNQSENILDTIQEGLDLANQIFGLHMIVKGGEKDDDISGMDEGKPGSLPDGNTTRSAANNQ